MKLLSYRNERNARFISAYYNKPLDKPDWYRVEAVSDEETHILLYDYIGWPFNEAAEFIKALSEIKRGQIVIRINSPGGDVWDANAIHNAIKDHPLKPITRIESLAASAASYIAIAGAERQSYKNGMMMIHEPMTGIYGNQYDLRETADVLEQVSAQMIDMYADHTNVGKRELKAMMKAETWMTAKAAKEKGFIDSVIESGRGVKASFDLTIFSNLPEEFRSDNANPVKLTGHDIERILHREGAPKAFAKAAAAACRAHGLFDRSQSDGNADEDALKEAEKCQAAELAASLRGAFARLM